MLDTESGKCNNKIQFRNTKRKLLLSKAKSSACLASKRRANVILNHKGGSYDKPR
jgi:hypothetical protein